MKNSPNSHLIIVIIEAVIFSIPTLFLVWKSWEKKQSSLTVKIIRNKKAIRKIEIDEKRAIERNRQDLERIKIDFEAKKAKLKIELLSLEQEAHYQQKISKFESGELGQIETNSTKTEVVISDLKNQGGQFIQKSMEKTNKVVEDLKNKGLGSLNSLKEKGTGVIKQFIPDNDSQQSKKKE